MHQQRKSEEYRELIESFVPWCNERNLKLNISKQQRVGAQLRDGGGDPVLVIIQREKLERVGSCKYLRFQINEKKWTILAGTENTDLHKELGLGFASRQNMSH